MPLIAVITLDGFNAIDSFVNSHILARVTRPGWRVAIAAPTPEVTSMDGVVVRAQMPLEDIAGADAVIVGSGVRTRDYAADPAFLAALPLDPERQLIGSQCSGALILARLGLLEDVPVCTDLITKPWVIEAGARVVDEPFHASGNVATAGGCLAGQYLAAWTIARLSDVETAREALFYVAPVGEKSQYLDRAMAHVERFLPA